MFSLPHYVRPSGLHCWTKPSFLLNHTLLVLAVSGQLFSTLSSTLLERLFSAMINSPSWVSLQQAMTRVGGKSWSFQPVSCRPTALSITANYLGMLLSFYFNSISHWTVGSTHAVFYSECKVNKANLLTNNSSSLLTFNVLPAYAQLLLMGMIEWCQCFSI